MRKEGLGWHLQSSHCGRLQAAADPAVHSGVEQECGETSKSLSCTCKWEKLAIVDFMDDLCVKERIFPKNVLLPPFAALRRFVLSEPHFFQQYQLITTHCAPPAKKFYFPTITLMREQNNLFIQESIRRKVSTGEIWRHIRLHQINLHDKVLISLESLEVTHQGDLEDRPLAEGVEEGEGAKRPKSLHKSLEECSQSHRDH